MAEIEVSLTVPTYGGESMGRLADGRAVFVAFGLPGETVRARSVDEKRGFARAALVEVLNPVPQRIAPRCIHFGICGGCHYQMLSYPEQLKLKETVLRDQLTRIGKIQDPPVQGMVPSPNEWNYRNHIQFHLTEDGRLGFIASGDGRAVVPISECHLPEASINALWPQLQFDAGTPLERVSLRAGDELMLLLESDSSETPEVEIEAEISVVHLSKDDSVVLAGDGHILVNALGRTFRVSAGSFFQVNTAMAAKMVEHLLSNLRVLPSTLLLDIYCGVGLFSAFFAPKVRQVIAIEISPLACDDFATNLHEFDNVDLYEAPAEQVLPQLNLHADVAIVDPPRAGLDKKVLDAILNLGPKTLAYISCDPSTLARDAARLIAGGYTLSKVTPFDLFPQTYHIESISIFER
jgi:23S rRNA (uracil1939-C5)-methyltransferase